MFSLEKIREVKIERTIKKYDKRIDMVCDMAIRKAIRKAKKGGHDISMNITPYFPFSNSDIIQIVAKEVNIRIMSKGHRSHCGKYTGRGSYIRIFWA